MEIRWNPKREEWQFWAYAGEPHRACWASLDAEAGWTESDADDAAEDAEKAFGESVSVTAFDDTDPEDASYREE
jgi:hypothetical protein